MWQSFAAIGRERDRGDLALNKNIEHSCGAASAADLLCNWCYCKGNADNDDNIDNVVDVVDDVDDDDDDRVVASSSNWQRDHVRVVAEGKNSI